MKKAVITKKDMYLFIIIFLLGTITTIFFLPFHTVPDTYNVLWRQQDYCTTFLQDVRIFSALFLWLGEIIKIPINVLDVTSNIIALTANCISVYIIYKNIENDDNDKFEKIILFVGAFIVVFNQFSMEHLAYFETGIMCIGKMLCVISAQKLIVQNRKIKSLMILTIAMFCYQGILNVFVITAIIFIATRTEKFKEIIKDILKIVLICICVFIFVFIEIKICNWVIGSQDKRAVINSMNKENLKMIFEISISILYLTFNIGVPNLIILTITTTLIILLINKRYYPILQYLLYIIIIVGSCTILILFTGRGAISARTASAIGGIAGFSIIILAKMTKENKVNLIAIFLLTIILFTANEYAYLRNGWMLLKSNRMEKQYGNAITKQIEKYENETGNSIKKIAIYKDKSSSKTFNNYKNNTFTIQSVYTTYAKMDFFRYYLNRNVEIKESEEKYIQYFKDRDWNEFDIEQMKFDGETLHICTF